VDGRKVTIGDAGRLAPRRQESPQNLCWGWCEKLGEVPGASEKRGRKQALRLKKQG